ncbi:Phosphotransferase enzyme family protein [Agromyces sp. CF514]|uniref:aminoglycoside phosphotransferase family protein n=1 Tax=Agromyces sp. CF514 TaxID=1881031 RepID=UPI0008EE4C0E|nr:aminoglycoside phosphotransferase family protein [Agromyces sp. CF514]SFR74195.1 Phosphotransferase enzyme family protein [Agromyces sp. CF514]
MGDGRSREVELELCLPTGEMLGTTASFTAAEPWTQFVHPVVAAAREQLGLDVTVLRVRDVETLPIWASASASASEPASTSTSAPASASAPVRVRYLAEVAARPDPSLSLLPVDAEAAAATRPDPLRMPWATPGGPATTLSWADSRLAELCVSRVAPAVQVRSWNLSSLWLLTTDAGTVWLKQVPPFFAHEGAVIERMSRHAVPRVLARRDDAVLLAEIPGEDLYEASRAQLATMIDLLVAMQRDCIDDVDDLLALGLPDWRLPALAELGSHALGVWADRLPHELRTTVESLIAGFDDRARRLDACGLPDTLVHGDFHSGNVRGIGLDLTVLDWGDSGVGHPLLDVAAFTQRLPSADAAFARAHWMRRWADTGADAAEALRLLDPVAALRQAIIYQGFLERIEADERVYHRDDPVPWFTQAARLAGDERAAG